MPFGERSMTGEVADVGVVRLSSAEVEVGDLEVVGDGHRVGRRRGWRAVGDGEAGFGVVGVGDDRVGAVAGARRAAVKVAWWSAEVETVVSVKSSDWPQVTDGSTVMQEGVAGAGALRRDGAVGGGSCRRSSRRASRW